MATVTPKSANWFTYFPEDYRWSSAVSGILGSAPWGGSDIGEIDPVCRPLRAALGNDEAWFDAWCAEAELQRTRARQAEERAHRITAGATYLRAGNYFQMAERFRTPKDKRAPSPGGRSGTTTPPGSAGSTPGSARRCRCRVITSCGSSA